MLRSKWLSGDCTVLMDSHEVCEHQLGKSN